MVSVQINGLDNVLKSLDGDNWLDPSKVDAAVKQVASSLVNTIKENYIKRGHIKSGALVNSIQAFQRKRKGKSDPFFTYYVGPKYGNGSVASQLSSAGGNAAHLLEYGTVERYAANIAKGGVGKKQGLSKIYGEKAFRGRIVPPTVGVIRLSVDQYGPIGIATLKEKMIALMRQSAKEKGLAA